MINPGVSVELSDSRSVISSAVDDIEASVLDHISTKQLTKVIESNMAGILEQFVFEMNTPAIRDNIVSSLHDFIIRLQDRRCIYDFAVVCDESNNPPSAIRDNQLICEIYIQPNPWNEEIMNFSTSIGNLKTRSGIVGGNTLCLDSQVLEKMEWYSAYDRAMKIIGAKHGTL
jgi:phage baseplate assembly protein W